MLPLVSYRRLWYTLSSVVFTVSIAGILLFGLKLGIDFTGGTMMEISFATRVPSNEEILKVVLPFDLGPVTMQPLGDRSKVLRFKPVEESERAKIFQAIVQNFDPEKKGTVNLERTEAIGPVLGAELKGKTFEALVFAILAILLYITYVFRKASRPVKSWKYGVAAIVALIHDVTIPVGLFAYLGRFQAVEVDSSIVTALLTVLGFSVHDTIVVFDRIRERLQSSKENFATVVNQSINQTIVRSINTSLTAFLALLSVYLFGGTSTQNFVLAMMVGIVVGTYSSIFIASPLLVSWHQWAQNRKA